MPGLTERQTRAHLPAKLLISRRIYENRIHVVRNCYSLAFLHRSESRGGLSGV